MFYTDPQTDEEFHERLQRQMRSRAVEEHSLRASPEQGERSLPACLYALTIITCT